MPNTAPLNYVDAATRWFGRDPALLGAAERRALTHAASGQALTEDPNRKLAAAASLGERMADRVAAFGGSWTFIALFVLTLLGWVVLNTEILGPTAFDAYPYIFLNLVLSMLAALQAPVIMMSQNRHAANDRQMAAHDYEINLKAEIEIMALHDKLDALRAGQLTTLLAQQQRQIELLTRLVGKIDPGTP